MQVQRVVLPASGAESWTVLGDDDAPVGPVERYLAYLTHIERSPNTVRAYAHDLKDYWEFLAGRSLDWREARLEDVGEYVAWLRLPPAGRAGGVAVLPSAGAHVTASTVNRKLSALAAFYQHQARCGVDVGELLVTWQLPGGRHGWKPFLHHVSKDRPQARRTVALKAPRKLPRVLTVTETQAILDGCEHLRDRFFIALLYDSGVRAGEALGLRHEDIAAAEQQVSIVPRANVNRARAKSWEQRTVPVSAQLIRLYGDYLHAEYGDLDCDYVFVNLFAGRLGQAMAYPAVYDLVRRHHSRWRQQGRPDVAEFTATASPRFAREVLARCQAPGCRYGVIGHGLCTGHLSRWRRAGQPDLPGWLATIAAADSPKAACLVPGCTLWAQPAWRLCRSHGRAWIYHGRPAITSYLACFEDRDPNLPAYESIDLRGLAPHLKLEMQYVLQCRRDQEAIKTPADPVRGVVQLLKTSPVTSFLDWPEETWRQHFPATSRGQVQAALAAYARRAVEDLAYGRGWQVEYPRDQWRLRNLGVGGPRATIRFGQISQPWLKDLAKRWTRYRLSTGLGPQQAGYGALAITRFSAFLAEAGARSLAGIGRELLERYLASLHAQRAGKTIPARDIGQLSAFFDAIRRHGWDDTLPAAAAFYPEDFPKQRYRLPRALAEQVMTQLEDPANLDRWDNPAYRLMTVILMRCGLRISSALTLSFDCIARDAGGAPYLRYVNTKMKREALVPIDEELAGQIRGHQQRVLQRWPGGTPVLFPRPKANIRGDRAIGSQSYREALHAWLERCDIRDEHGKPARITPHQWRHTLGTRLINQDVPQEVVRRILDHDSPQMTAHYARLHDTTVREHWERARKVNARGQTVTLAPGGPLADAAWANQRLGRVTQALPNGYCGLPVQRSCPHANACLTCPMFLTTGEFLPRHREQHQQTLQIISAAEARGQERLAEMNRQVAANLQKVITALESEPGAQEAAGAR